jgi:hypothetical protein
VTQATVCGARLAGEPCGDDSERSLPNLLSKTLGLGSRAVSSIFLSHSHEDKAFARHIASDLRLAGHAVWIDEAEIKLGDSLIGKIREGLDQVDFVVAIVSATSVNSEWVTRELDIASNRELSEGRVVVLPLLLERVPLPGFLQGKFYADFIDSDAYDEGLALLLDRLGPATPIPVPDTEELDRLRAELAIAEQTVAAYRTEAEGHRTLALRGKSPSLVAAIAKANSEFPEHAPINTTYAFEVNTMPVTLDYLLWAVAKAGRKGSHPLEIFLTLENKWPEAEAMLSAYADLLEARERSI